VQHGQNHIRKWLSRYDGMRLGSLRQPLGMIESYKLSFYCNDLTNFVAFVDYDFVSSNYACGTKNRYGFLNVLLESTTLMKYLKISTWGALWSFQLPCQLFHDLACIKPCRLIPTKCMVRIFANFAPFLIEFDMKKQNC